MTELLKLLMILSLCVSSIAFTAVRSTSTKIGQVESKLGMGSYFDDESEDDRSLSRNRRRRKVTLKEDLNDIAAGVNEGKYEYTNYDDIGNQGIIPNPILDSIDPEGAADRFPELLQDKKFWVDTCLLLLFLNFMDNIRTGEMFEIWDLATAGEITFQPFN